MDYLTAKKIQLIWILFAMLIFFFVNMLPNLFDKLLCWL